MFGDREDEKYDDEDDDDEFRRKKEDEVSKSFKSIFYFAL